MARSRVIVWHQREFVEEDLDGQFLVYAATDDREVNARIYRHADQANRVANAVDDLDHCNFIAPAVARQGVVQVAISTAGSSPALAKQIRDQVQQDVLTPEVAALAEYLGSWRPEVKRHIDTYQRRQDLWEGVLEGCVPGLLASGQQPRADDAMRSTCVGRPCRTTRTRAAWCTKNGPTSAGPARESDRE